MTLEALCREFILDIEAEALAAVSKIPGIRPRGLSEKRREEFSRAFADLFRLASAEAVSAALHGYQAAS